MLETQLQPAQPNIPFDHANTDLIAHEPASLGVRLITILALVVPLAGLITAMVLVWGWGFRWLDLGLLVGMYLLTAVGITIGFHRLFTHKSFETSRVLKAILAVLGSMALEGPMVKWVAMHRRHHQHSDNAEDPHSPHHHGNGVKGVLLGFWHAHLGWMFDEDPTNLKRYVADLLRDNWLRRISATWTVWAAAGLLIPALIGGLYSGTWGGALLGFLWGGLARIFLVHHVTWSVNSICHLWGTRPYRSHDESRNNFVVGVLALGEGWHNNHHAFPTSARHGLRWWQIDVAYLIIRASELIGLTWDVKVPTSERMALKRA